MFDSHCHLDFPELAPQLHRHLEDAVRSGVRGFFVPGCHEHQWDDLAQLRALPFEIYVGVGQHPYWSNDIEDTDALLEKMRKKALELNAAAIGECGFDKGRGAPLHEQALLFEGQLKLARELNLPVVVHQVGGQRELLESVARVGLPDAGAILHGFQGDLSWGRSLLKRGFFLGVGLAATRPQRAKLRSAVGQLPLQKLLLETDAPDQGVGEGPGVPRDLLAVRDAVAELAGVDPLRVGEVTAGAARAIYGPGGSGARRAADPV